MADLFPALTIVMIYLLPTWIAGLRRIPNPGGLFTLNIMTGWTGLGWILCLVWACLARPEGVKNA